MPLLGRRLCVLAAFCVVTLARMGTSHGENVAKTDEPQYLTFQLFTAGPGFSTEGGKHALSRLPPVDFLDAQTKQILDAVGQRGDERHRLGIVVGPLAMDYTDDQLRALIERTFALAAKYKIAVGLHIDDSKFWSNRRDLWKNPANVEWLDWKGAANTGQYLNWGEPWKLAPQACFNSPDLLSEARRISGGIIGPAIAAEVAKLHQTGDEALFAGVIVGWETAIGRDFDTQRDLGYCALTNLGLNAKTPPHDLDRALESVVADWIGTWSKGLVDAGVPAGRVYSHIAFSAKKKFDEDASRPRDRSYSRSVLYTPPRVAFGDTHRPGFSTYPNGDVLREIYGALGDHDHPHWISAEGANVDFENGPPAIPEQGMEDYLARMFNHGATMTNVFGWGIGEPDNVFRRATEGPDSIAAYRKFLRGDTLTETPLDQSYRSNLSLLQKLMRALPARIESYQRSGGDMGLLQPEVERLQDNMKAGRFEAMKAALDKIESTIDRAVAAAPRSNDPSGFDITALQDKMHALPHRIDLFQQRNGDINRVKARVESIQKRIASGQLKTAYEELQALDPILDAP